jgi:hypothetical protein
MKNRADTRSSHVADKATDGNWLPELFKAARVPDNANLETIQVAMDNLANRVAPLTRQWWKWILLLQGITIFVPLAWFRRPLAVPLSWVAMATFLTVVIFVCVNWWLRWRGMQKTWARARLVAEVARSLNTTQVCPRPPAIEALSIVPSLQPLGQISRRTEDNHRSSDWRDVYLKNRIEDQWQYFHSRQETAQGQRKRLSRWGTLMLDISLAFAFAGIVITLSPHAEAWRRIFGDRRFEIALGLAGVVAPLVLLLVQLLRGVQELNRRTARYAQQQRMLDKAKERLAAAPTDEEAMTVVDDTERQLLAEVLEWYFHAETAEHFFVAGNKEGRKIAPRLRTGSGYSNFLAKSLGITSLASLFLLRVILGRLPWIVASGAAALMWVAYHQPSDQATQDQLKLLARLADTNGNDWIPDPDKLTHGCVVIVHGLYGDIRSGIDTSKGWPKACGKKIQAAMGDKAPDVCVVDWHQAAQTARYNNLSVGVGASEDEDILTDLSGVRAQAEEVGNLLAFRLAMMIMDQTNPTISKDRPLHLIGHSAGGFIVARVAMLLKKFNAAPSQLHVTILDTPAPTPEMFTTLPDLYPDGTIDFYISSVMGGRRETFQAANFSPKIHHKVVAPKVEAQEKNQNIVDKIGNIWTEHRYSFEWYMETIDHPKSAPEEGFNRSPLLKFNQIEVAK